MHLEHAKLKSELYRPSSLVFKLSKLCVHTSATIPRRLYRRSFTSENWGIMLKFRQYVIYDITSEPTNRASYHS
jgi:hypothetical protein